MFYAFLTALLWSASSISSARTARHLGGPRGNRARLTLAVGLLTLWLAATSGLHGWGAGAWWFVASGAVGLGLGDMALFSAYARLGARLPALFTHCLGAPLGAAIEWAWLGTPLHWPEAACIAVILGGVALALAPDRHALFTGKGGDRSFLLGCTFGLLSACGLGLSAVMSRKGFAVAHEAGAAIGGLDAALLRNLGGLAVCMVWAPWTRKPEQPVEWHIVWPWLAFTALVGPTLGVVCYQMALAEVKVGVVQAVVALVPLAVIPLAWAIDGDKPRKRAWIGGLLGVAGVAGMALIRHPG